MGDFPNRFFSLPKRFVPGMKSLKRYFHPIYIEAQYVLDAELEEKYKCYLADLDKQTARCRSFIEQAFSANYREAFLKSMMLAQVTGAEESQILKNIEEIDDFFLD